jgi:Protein of unknown function (DUF3558)
VSYVKRLVVLAGLAATLVVTAACGGPTTGQPSPATTAESAVQTTSDGGSGGTSTSSGDAGALPVNHPCSVLSSEDLSQLGVSSSPTEDMTGTAPDCAFQTADNFTVGIAIRTNVGLSGFALTGGTAHSVTIGSHSAMQGVDNTGSCVVGIGVSSSSRVDVTALGDGKADPCPTASSVAHLIEPKLP